MCRDVNAVYDASLGAVNLALVLLLPIVGNDVYASKYMRHGLRIAQRNRTNQVYFNYRCYREKEPPIR